MNEPVDIPDTRNTDSTEDPDSEYESPKLIGLGHTRDLAQGSSGSGNADANSQYYW